MYTLKFPKLKSSVMQRAIFGLGQEARDPEGLSVCMLHNSADTLTVVTRYWEDTIKVCEFVSKQHHNDDLACDLLSLPEGYVWTIRQTLAREFPEMSFTEHLCGQTIDFLKTFTLPDSEQSVWDYLKSLSPDHDISPLMILGIAVNHPPKSFYSGNFAERLHDKIDSEILYAVQNASHADLMRAFREHCFDNETPPPHKGHRFKGELVKILFKHLAPESTLKPVVVCDCTFCHKISETV